MKKKKSEGDHTPMESSSHPLSKSSESGQHSIKLDKTLSSDKSQAAIKKAQKILKEHRASVIPEVPLSPVTEITDKNPPSSGPRPEMDSSMEVEKAADTLTSAVDQMVPSLLLAIGLLDNVLKWVRVVAVFMGLGALVAVFIAVRTENAASVNERASKAVAAAKEDIAVSKAELVKANQELADIREDLKKLRTAIAKQEVDQASQPKIVPGDRPGEVAIVTPTIAPAELEKAKKAAEKAVNEGREPPPPPKAKKATKIPAYLRPAEVEEFNNVFKK